MFAVLAVVFYALWSVKIEQPITNTEAKKVGHEYAATKTETVYELMHSLQIENKINFTEKTYIGMGKFIDSIDGVYGNGSRNWIYYVNGQKASIGVSNYKLNPGDILSWKYEKNI